VKALEDRGIGRPSTVRVDPRDDPRPRLRREEGHRARADRSSAFAVTKLLEEHYGSSSTTGSRRAWRTTLDKIAAGEEQRVDWLTRFYKGENGEPGLHAMVTDHLDEIDARAVNSIEIPRSDIVVRVGRYGPYLERGDERGVAAGGHRPGRAHPERAEELLSAPSGGRVLGEDPETGRR
jgi:DNA topoisomerase-1